MADKSANIALLIGLLACVGIVLAIEVLPGYAPLGNILVGAMLALGATYYVERWKRAQLRNDLAVALYHELAVRVARCCYDFEAPWADYWEGGTSLDRFGAGKFAPEVPAIFAANADKIALFGEDVPSALMSFYFRLGVLRRDIENLRADTRDHSNLTPGAVRVIGSRFAAALSPGLRALDALAPSVANTSKIEADALDTFDSAIRRKRATKTLRDLLDAMITKAAEVRAKVEP